MDKAHGKDMLAVKNALSAALGIRELWDTGNIRFETEYPTEYPIEAIPADRGDSGGYVKTRLMGLRDLLERGICDEPAILLSEGNLIRSGYSSDLDQLRRLKDTGRQMLEEYLEEEKLLSGIISLKIRYNRLIGYFFEVTKNNLSRVPSHFIRRQGIMNGERYSTERLAALESDINGASDKIIELERVLFLEIREQAKNYLDDLLFIARRIAELDAAQSLAKAASVYGWIRPVLDNSTCLEIIESRHPVVEAHLGRAEFIPNDIILGSDDGVSFALITGPNMAGKSTYLRSAALIAIMAQMGGFVPARRARLGICDRIYCRVGASDNVARGESTFLVEMNETAFILNTATSRSLVIMDEVGRGTGTNDGLSIAWAVSEELLDRIQCRTLFATHYHELSLIQHRNLANRSMEVLEENGEIIFLRKLKDGPAAESYGIHVARLAGLSDAVVERAQEIMGNLRERDAGLGQSGQGDPLASVSPQSEPALVHAQNGDKESCRHSAAICKEIESLDINAITPLQALDTIGQWQKKLANAYIKKTAPAIPEHKSAKSGLSKPVISTPSLFD
jgi:DNA mismatch repair protein MutS